MKRTILVWSMVGTLLLVFSQPPRAEAQEGTPTGEADAETYIHLVVKGDTLWDISNSLFGKGWHYKKIWVNRKKNYLTNDPNLIFPGMLFVYRSNTKDLKSDSSFLNQLNAMNKNIEIISQNSDTLKIRLKTLADLRRYSINRLIASLVQILISIIVGAIGSILASFIINRIFPHWQ